MQVVCDHGRRSENSETKIMPLLRRPEGWAVGSLRRRIPSLQNIRTKALRLPPAPRTVVDDLTGRPVDPNRSDEEGLHESFTFTCHVCGNSLSVRGDRLNSILNHLADAGLHAVSIDLLRQCVSRRR